MIYIINILYFVWSHSCKDGALQKSGTLWSSTRFRLFFTIYLGMDVTYESPLKSAVKQSPDRPTKQGASLWVQPLIPNQLEWLSTWIWPKRRYLPLQDLKQGTLPNNRKHKHFQDWNYRLELGWWAVMSPNLNSSCTFRMNEYWTLQKHRCMGQWWQV